MKKMKLALVMIIFFVIYALFSRQIGLASSLFDTRMDFLAGDGAWSVAAGDLDGNGHLDLAVANIYDHNVSILLGTGDGTFQSAVNYETGIWPVSVTIGDLDGDGDLDLAVANCNSDSVSVLLNTTIEQKRRIPIPWILLLGD